MWRAIVILPDNSAQVSQTFAARAKAAGNPGRPGGSGLSRDNRVSARQLTALVEGVLARDPTSARVFRESLAVAGRSGTLEKRLRGTAAEGRVFAKTGWIRGTSALSGYVETLEGALLCFSILVEYPDV